jgi:maltose/maltodextrin transport system substrate-binding protein
MKNAAKYRFTVWMATRLTFEANEPWAPLSPIWNELPVGNVVLKVEGLDRKGGKPVRLATIDWSQHERDRSFRRFHRKAVFNGPYHEAASEYTASAFAWLRWLAVSDFKEWKQEGNPRKLKGYPSKFVGAAIAGLTALAAMETDPRHKKEDLRMSGNAARTLIAASFPADWGLAYFPPTYSDEIDTVMMNYPAGVGHAYLDLYEATGDKQMLEAAKRIAETYKKVQLPNGTWPLLMTGKSGERATRSKTDLIPDGVFDFFRRLIENHRINEYRPMADATWRWIQEDTLATFRFEGQFEDTGREGSRTGNLSPVPVGRIAEYLLRHRGEDSSYVGLAEEALRFAEDQFVIWEQPVESDVNRDQFPRLPFTPCVLEQYAYMVPVSGSAAILMDAYRVAYETTGKELYLAKAIAFANAMTVIQKKNGGDYVGTFWNPGNPGGWPNVHAYSSSALARLGGMLSTRNLRVPVKTDRVSTEK